MFQVTLSHYLILSALLFSLGIAGVLLRKNAIIIFMSIELMLNGVNLSLVAFSVYLNDIAGQIMVLFVMTVAAAEVAVGLGIITMIYKMDKTIDISELKIMKW